MTLWTASSGAAPSRTERTAKQMGNFHLVAGGEFADGVGGAHAFCNLIHAGYNLAQHGEVVSVVEAVCGRGFHGGKGVAPRAARIIAYAPPSHRGRSGEDF